MKNFKAIPGSKRSCAHTVLLVRGSESGPYQDTFPTCTFVSAMGQKLAWEKFISQWKWRPVQRVSQVLAQSHSEQFSVTANSIFYQTTTLT